MITPRTDVPNAGCHRPPLRGTVAGYVHHNLNYSPIRDLGANARRTYLDNLRDQWAAKVPTSRPELKAKAFIEDYLYLIDTGEDNVEAIATRLGTTPLALERRLQRLGVHPLHRRVDHRTADRAKVAA